jgi:hypothetical protein
MAMVMAITCALRHAENSFDPSSNAARRPANGAADDCAHRPSGSAACFGAFSGASSDPLSSGRQRQYQKG